MNRLVKIKRNKRRVYVHIEVMVSCEVSMRYKV